MRPARGSPPLSYARRVRAAFPPPRLTGPPAHPMFQRGRAAPAHSRVPRKGKPPARVGRKAVGPPGTARLPKGVSPPGGRIQAGRGRVVRPRRGVLAALLSGLTREDRTHVRESAPPGGQLPEERGRPDRGRVRRH